MLLDNVIVGIYVIVLINIIQNIVWGLVMVVVYNNVFV